MTDAIDPFPPHEKDDHVALYPPGSWLNPDNPAGNGTTSAGRFSIPTDGGRFDRHHHDDDELWFIASGKALLAVGDAQLYVQAGDIVLVPAGEPHDVLAVYETLSGFFTETGHPSGGRAGHLHSDAADEAGHDVPSPPLPADFPARDAA